MATSFQGNIPEAFKKALLRDDIKKAQEAIDKPTKGKKKKRAPLHKRDREKKESPPPNRNMGIGKLGSPEAVFVRKFRWTLEGTGLEPHFMKRIKIDHQKRLIHMKIYEVAITDSHDINTLEWADRIGKHPTLLNEDKLLLTTFDGCGVPIYEYHFKGLMLTEREVSFDYADSGEATQNITVAYKECNRNYLLNDPEWTKAAPEFFWSAQLRGNSYQTDIVDVEIEDRPSLNIKESEVNFLNAKTWLPGKSKWEKMKIKLNKQARKEFLRELLDGSYDDLLLYFYKGRRLGSGPVELMETWTLNHVRVSNILDIDEEFCTLQLRYNGVKYKPKPEHLDDLVKDHHEDRGLASALKREKYQRGQPHV